MELNILDKRQTCANCRFNDGMIYTSYPVKYKCTFDNEYYEGMHSCHFELTPIVRCRDCTYYRKNEYDPDESMMCMCWNDWLPTEPEDFCSNGERK